MCTGKYIECSKVVTTKPTKRMTKREQRVMDMHQRLPEISPRQREWMRKNFPMVGYYWKRGEVWCQHCGHVEKVSIPELAVSLEYDDYICPACNSRLTLKHHAEKHGRRDEEYMGQYKTIVTSCGGMQVFRTYLVERRNVKGEPTEYREHDIYENWVDGEGREVIISRQYHRSVWNLRWEYDSPWSVKKHNGGCSGYYVSQDLYDIRNNWFYPIWRMSPNVRRNGWRKVFQDVRMQDLWGVSPVKMVQALLMYPECEMLVKNGQLKMFHYLLLHGREDVAKYIPSIRICNRNGYIIDDPGIWCDYIDVLQHFGKDVHNAHYVCPEDLSQAHDRWMRKKIDGDMKLAEKFYKKDKGRYFGICFGNDHIVVTVIRSIADMALEGKYMNHCVYKNEYYKKKNSLILSARDMSGNRLETVEISLRNWCVLQSRGISNNPTQYHDEIVRLVNENMYQFKKAV